MKKLIATLLMAVSATAMAHGPHSHRHYYGGNNWAWIPPAAIVGAVVYGMTRPAAPPPQPVIVVPPNYPLAPQGYHYEQVLDANCNCYRWVLVQGY